MGIGLVGLYEASRSTSVMMYSVMVIPYASAWSSTSCLNLLGIFMVMELLVPLGRTGGRPTLRFII